MVVVVVVELMEKKATMAMLNLTEYSKEGFVKEIRQVNQKLLLEYCDLF